MGDPFPTDRVTAVQAASVVLAAQRIAAAGQRTAQLAVVPET